MKPILGRPLLAHLLAVLGGLGLALGLAEGYFRIFNPQPIRPSLYLNDPIYGITMAPGLKGYWREPEYLSRFQLNALGFRDPERQPRKPKGTFRIIGMGDSFSWGLGVQEDETFLRKLEVALNQKTTGRRYEVLNWGVAARSTAQQLLCLEHEALAYQPDLIILEYYRGGDLEGNLYSGLFTLQKGKLVRAAYGRAQLSRIKRLTEHMPLYRALTQHSHLVNFVRSAVLGWVESRDRRRVVAVTTADGRLTDSIRLTKAILTEFFAIASRHGIRVVMVVIPDKDEAAGTTDPTDALRSRKIVQEGAMLTDVCRTHHVPLLDFSPVFARRGVFPSYYRRDPHLTAYGHALIANSLSKFLKAMLP